jgi:hypothetical protein
VSRRSVVVSDLSGKMALDEAPVVVRVLDHPELGGSPVELDVLESEVEDLSKQARDFALIEVRRSGQEPLRYALSAEDFDKAATERPMADVLREAPTVREEAGPRRRGRPRKSAEGAPSRGKSDRDFDIAALRAWARSNNIEVPQRGRISQSTVEQYKAAMGES